MTLKEHINRISLQDADHLGREDDEGSVEYKWKLVGIAEDRLEHLVSQMKYRVTEGQGECIYEIGVTDDGLPKGLDEAEFAETISTLRRMADRLQCDLSIVCEKVVQQEPLMKCAEVMVRKFGVDDFVDIRISMCGHVGSGKSTLVGVLTRGVLDNGRGSARQNVFNHRHEVESGLTSSISQQILGFGSRGNVVNYGNDQLCHVPAERIAEMSSKVCTLYDLAGHEKYLKTTVAGMTGSALDYACLVIRADKGIQQMTREHLGLCCSLHIPFFCVVTCMDLCEPARVEDVMLSIKNLLKLPGVRKQASWIQDEDDVIVSARSIKSGTVPVFLTSCVDGQSLDMIRKFLNLLPVRREWEVLAKLPVEVVVDKLYQKVEGTGTVVAGVVEQGCVCYGDQLAIGPDEEGNFIDVRVDTIHVKRVNVRKVEAGMHATFAISHGSDPEAQVPMNIHKGMILADPKGRPGPLEGYWRFEADVTVLFASGRIQNNFQPVVHCRMIRQKARLFLPAGVTLHTGEQGRVQFEFLFVPEFLKEGLHFVFMEGNTKGIGTVKRVVWLDAPPKPKRTSPRPRCRSQSTLIRSDSGRSEGERPRFYSGRSPPSGGLVGAGKENAGPPPRNAGCVGPEPKTKKEKRHEKRAEEKDRRLEEKRRLRKGAPPPAEDTEFNIWAE